MRSRIVFLLFLLSLSVFARAQNGPANGQPEPVLTTQITMPVFMTNPSPAFGATLGIVGNPGRQTIYYWISANYLVGSASLAGPFVETQARDVLSATNYVTINPQLPAAATSYDVLKTSTPIQPTGACACAVATAVSPGAITNDRSNSTGAYTVNPANIAALTMTLTNEVQSAHVSHLILRQNGVPVCDLSTACGAGSATIGGSGTPGYVPIFTAPTTIGDSQIQQTGTGPVYGLTMGANGASAHMVDVLDYGTLQLVPEFNDSAHPCSTSPCWGEFIEDGYSGAGLANGFVGLNAITSYTASSITSSGVAGASIEVQGGGAGNIQTLTGAGVYSYAVGTGAVTNQYGLQVQSNFFGAGGTIASNKGIDVITGSVEAGSGSTTNDYGIYLEPLSAAGASNIQNHAGIYIADQGATNYANSNWYALHIASQSVGPGYTKQTYALAIDNAVDQVYLGGGISGCLYLTGNILTGTGAACGSGGGGGTGSGAVASVATDVSLNTIGFDYQALEGSANSTSSSAVLQTLGSGSNIVSELNVQLSLALGSTQTLTITLGDASTGATAVTCTVPNSGSTCSDATHSYTVPAGHLVLWSIGLNTGSITENIAIGAQVGTGGSGTYLPLAGGTMTGKLTTVAPASTFAGLNIGYGTTPLSGLVNGDLWATSAGLFAQIAGATVGPFGTGGGSAPATVGIPNVTSPNTFGTSFYNNGYAPRMMPETTPTDGSLPTIVSTGWEGQGWLGYFPDGTFIYVDKFQPLSGNLTTTQYRLSYDQGQTWSAPVVVFQGTPTINYGCCGGLITNTGRLILEYRPTISGVVQGIYTTYSDNPEAATPTWSTPVQITSDATQTFYSEGIALPNGSIMISTYGGSGTGPSPYTCLVFTSTDNGVSWSAGVPIVSTTSFNPVEPAIVSLGGQNILAITRGGSGTNTVEQFLSTDYGATWADQGGWAIDSEGNSPWLNYFYTTSGRRVIELSYDFRSHTGTNPNEYMMWGYAANLLASGTAGWMFDSITPIGHFPFCQNNAGDNGYQSRIHPYGTAFGYGTYYQYTDASCTTTTNVFYTIPNNDVAMPFDVLFGQRIGIGGTGAWTPTFPLYDVDDGGSLGMNVKLTTHIAGDNGYSMNGRPFIFADSLSNVFLGIGSTCQNVTGGLNLIVGGDGLCYLMSSATRNTFLGNSAAGSITTGNDNIGIGYAGGSTVTGRYNLYIGDNIAASNTNTTSEMVIGNAAANITGHGSYSTTLYTGYEAFFTPGIISSGSSFTPTSPIAMTVTATPYTIASWALNGMPAQTLRFRCDGTYTTTTSTDTLSIGMNASSAPTLETGNATIESTLTGVETQGHASSTSPGYVNILTGDPVSSVTTIPWSVFGTITTVANTSTFSIQGELTGSSPSGQIDIGTSCYLGG